MNLLLQTNSPLKIDNLQVNISGSKSETNRLLLLQALYPEVILENTSNSDDSEVMTKALGNSIIPNDDSQLVDIHHAGTAMRFLTSFFAIQDGKKTVLTGSERMQQRPIKILVEALRQLGAEIEYLSNDGFPPILITGKKITLNKIEIDANVSSQYISALILIAPKLENGLEITLNGNITSIPYIKMTLALLHNLAIKTSFIGNKICIARQATLPNPAIQIVESDWSSASYFYSIVALSPIGSEITLSNFKENSLQGDSILQEIYKDFGVETAFGDGKVTIKKIENTSSKTLFYNLESAPDIAQTIAVTCFGLQIGCELIGLHTLKIKETDRLEALKSELTKLGATISVTDCSLTLESSNSIIPNCTIKTYQDHRMAMAFAPLALTTTLVIEDAEVVSKSYPNFWNDLKNIGFIVKEN
jgi:3-phosphoshikimate 1-carboxyvinyltransferase